MIPSHESSSAELSVHVSSLPCEHVEAKRRDEKVMPTPDIRA